MKNNIFEGAKFGDKFLTRDGKVAIYLYYNEHLLCKHCLCINGEEPQWFKDNGRFLVREDCDWNIVSRYQEAIDEKELDELADKENPNCNVSVYSLEYTRWNSGFKAGYKKCLEQHF